jgi:hypothetical protein
MHGILIDTDRDALRLLYYTASCGQFWKFPLKTLLHVYDQPYYTMAAFSPDSIVELKSQSQQVLIDITWAKKAIGKVGRLLRELLEPEERNRERVDSFIQHGLLEQKDLKDVVKGLQQKIAECPTLFEVLLHKLTRFSSDKADYVVKKLQGMSYLICKGNCINS